MKKKTATLTFHDADNYGAILQAYALQTVIIKNGHSNVILNYKNLYLNRPWSKISFRRKGFIKYILGVGYFLVRLLRKCKFDNFRRDYLVLTNPIAELNDFALVDNYDLIIAGSDQVWNPYLTNFDKNYFLDFVKDNSKKGSYAASFGVKFDEDNAKNFVATMIKEFKYLNVREVDGKKLIENLTGRNSDVVLDPCMLLENERWNDIAIETSVDSYVLVYQTTFCKQLLLTAKSIASRHKLKIVCIPFPMGKILNAKTCFTAGPREWLGLIKNANIVLTDSFHGTVFSIIFNVPFYVTITGAGSRILNLLESFQLNERLLKTGEVLNHNQEINWDLTNMILNSQRIRSLKILEQMLNA